MGRCLFTHIIDMVINCSCWDILSISLTSVINLAPSNVYCFPGCYVIEISSWSKPDGDIESIHAGLLCCLYAQRVNAVFFDHRKERLSFCDRLQFWPTKQQDFLTPPPFFCKYLLPTEEHPSEVFFACLIHAALPPSLLKKHSDLSWNGFRGKKAH